MKKALYLLFLCMGFLNAKDIKVSSATELSNAVAAARNGDTITVKNGMYTGLSLTVAVDDIIIRAETPGGVFLNGGTTVVIAGNSVTFSGFQFTSGSIPGIAVTVQGDHDILTQLNFNGYSSKKYISLEGQYDEVSFCNFENKPATAPKGNLIHIATRADSSPGYALIKYCSFQNMQGNGGDNGNECIRITNATPSTYKSRTIVEHCYFENTGLGDSEVISVKSEENIIRYNTMKNNILGNFCFRNGDDNVAYGNFFIDSGGIRVKEANNIYCYNNYFERCGNGKVTAPVKYIPSPGNLRNIYFIFNTFIEGTPVELAAGATANIWANNIFVNQNGLIFYGSPAGISFIDNMYSGTTGISADSGLRQIDPCMIVNSDGYFDLSPSSPAINQASDSIPPIFDIPGLDDDPRITLDIKGLPRPTDSSAKDIGCSEYANRTSVNKPLSLADVGPSYLR